MVIDTSIFDTAKPKEVKQLKLSEGKRQKLQSEVDKLQGLIKISEKKAIESFGKFQEKPTKATEAYKDVLYAKFSIQHWKLHYYQMILDNPTYEKKYIGEYKERVEKDKEEVEMVKGYCEDKELVKEVLKL